MSNSRDVNFTPKKIERRQRQIEQGYSVTARSRNEDEALTREDSRNVTHDVANIGSDRTQLRELAKATRHAMGKRKVRALTDRGHFNAREIKACNDAGIDARVPKSPTSSAKAEGRFDRGDFIYLAKDDQYQRPPWQRVIYLYGFVERRELTLRTYWIG